MRVTDAVKETTADVLSVSPSPERMTTHTTPTNTQLIHQFVLRCAYAVNLVLIGSLAFILMTTDHIHSRFDETLSVLEETSASLS